MNEYDRADFKGIYEGKSLLKSAQITSAPWEIGEAQPIVCQILDSMPPSQLLDVGCGLGRNAKAASDRGYEVVGIDISSAAIEHCQEIYSNSQISFRELNACNTELTQKFKVILDSATYHAIPATDRIAYLTEMRRLATEDTAFHLITFAPSINGMPKPLASELSDIAQNVESSGWKIKLAERVEYKGNAAAIEDFKKKKGLDIELDDQGRTRLPAWHLVLCPTI